MELNLAGDEARECPGQPLDRHPDLLHAVSVSNGYSVVLQGIVIDCDGKGRPDLILSPVTPADSTGIIILGKDGYAAGLCDPAGDYKAIMSSGEDSNLDGTRRESKHTPDLAIDLITSVTMLEAADHPVVPYEGSMTWASHLHP